MAVQGNAIPTFSSVYSRAYTLILFDKNLGGHVKRDPVFNRAAGDGKSGSTVGIFVPGAFDF